MKITQSREFINLEQKAHGYKWGVKSWSDWGLLFRFLIIICKLLEQNQRPKRKGGSAWTTFLGEQMRAGKTIKEAAKLWKAR